MRNRTVAIVLSIVLMALQLCAAVPVHAEQNGKKDSNIIVSLGDSFSAGEGIEPFYKQDLPIEERVKEEDWLAHRSQKSWGGMLTLPTVDGPMREHRNENWYFAACTGAVTANIDYSDAGNQKRPYDRDGQKDTGVVHGQLDIFKTKGLDPDDVDYVTITIGGNDLGFVKVLEKGYNFGCDSEVRDFLMDRLEHFNDPDPEYNFHDKIKSCYCRIHEAAKKATIIVAGYPELMQYTYFEKSWPYSPDEVSDINTAVRLFNQLLEQIVKECAEEIEGMNIEFVSVEDAFAGHQAFSADPYINSIIYNKQPQDVNVNDLVSSYSMHPNEKGAMAYAACVQAKINELEGATREVVLVLDASGSMAGEPLEQTKAAAHKFIETVLPEDTAVAVVKYSSDAARWSGFSMNKSYLDQAVNDLLSGGGTNIEAGLKEAASMLPPDHTAKRQLPVNDMTRIIVLMSDGEANEGKTGDDLIAYANELKDRGIIIYTLGFFHELSDRSEPQRIMDGIATDPHHYEVESADDLVFFFGAMADQINGTKFVYIRMECPIDVTVTYNGETLSSAEDSYNTRTSFGTLSFEDNSETGERTKILRLREDVANFDVQITGTGEGTMNYTIGYVDDNGDYTDMRTIEEVPITESTVIDTGVNRLVKTDLAVDSDGDGEVDEHYTATGPNVIDLTEQETNRDFPLLWVAGIGGAIVVLTVLTIVLIRKKKRERAEQRFCGGCGAPIPRGKDVCPNCGRRAQ